ncbi:hypothetical protein LCM20_09485 [Halobacillus litoralis]|uniref:hypothetical protein n=1 Tax=Halobacillus litoralis TaxID=45668 RepID=UPI001CD2C920|nr:hypothetical protein [Halobacillus litoralis]MCA0970821.1 hypothetical protein [Halobacillus litoralis]
MKNEKKRSAGLTQISVIGGGAAGWGINLGLGYIADMDLTHLYGISILLGVIVGLLWDIADKLND